MNPPSRTTRIIMGFVTIVIGAILLDCHVVSLGMALVIGGGLTVALSYLNP